MPNDAVVLDDSTLSDAQLLKLMDGGEVEESPNNSSGQAAPAAAGAENNAASEPAKEDPAVEPGKKQEPKQAPVVEDDEEKNVPKGIKKRFSELTGEIRALKAELAKHQKPAEGGPGAASPAEPAKPEEPKMPDLETFPGTYKEYQAKLAEYVGKLTDYKLKLAEEASAAKAASDAAAQRQRDQAKAWEEAETKVKAKPDRADYDEVADSVELPGDAPASGAIAQAIQLSDIGPELLYHLGKNPAVVKQLTAMSPIAAVRELGKIEAKLTAEPVKPTAAAPKEPLPKPPAKAPAGQGGGDAVDLNSEAMSQAVFNREAKRLLNLH
jgi:hypothetical protein